MLSKERVSEHLVPCIVQFGVATQDDSLWKTLNYQILLKTRHTSPPVKPQSTFLYQSFALSDIVYQMISKKFTVLLSLIVFEGYETEIGT